MTANRTKIAKFIKNVSRFTGILMLVFVMYIYLMIPLTLLIVLGTIFVTGAALTMLWYIPSQISQVMASDDE